MPVQADLTIGGQPRKVVMVANRNGFFYTLDRETGKLLVGKPFIDSTNWAKEIGADGRPIVLDNIGTPDECLPGSITAAPTSMPPSFDPDRRLFFVTAHETCAIWEPRKPTPPISHGRARAERRPHAGRRTRTVRGAARHRSDHRRAAVGAPLPRYPSTVSLDLTGGIMSTASGLVFTGDNDGYFYAFDAATGKELWRFQTGAPLWGSAPISYMLDGRQWVVVPSGLSLMAFALPKAS